MMEKLDIKILLLASIGMFINVLNFGITNVASPPLQLSFHTTTSAMSWVVPIILFMMVFIHMYSLNLPKKYYDERHKYQHAAERLKDEVADINQPLRSAKKYTIIGQVFLNEQTLFQLKREDIPGIIEKTAKNIYSDKSILKSLSSEDAYLIGYVSASERAFSDMSLMLSLKKDR